MKLKHAFYAITIGGLSFALFTIKTDKKNSYIQPKEIAAQKLSKVPTEIEDKKDTEVNHTVSLPAPVIKYYILTRYKAEKMLPGVVLPSLKDNLTNLKVPKDIINATISRFDKLNIIPEFTPEYWQIPTDDILSLYYTIPEHTLPRLKQWETKGTYFDSVQARETELKNILREFSKVVTASKKLNGEATVIVPDSVIRAKRELDLIKNFKKDRMKVTPSKG